MRPTINEAQDAVGGRTLAAAEEDLGCHGEISVGLHRLSIRRATEGLDGGAVASASIGALGNGDIVPGHPGTSAA